MIEVAVTIFVALGLAFNLFGCLGLVRLPDIYNRLQAATKCTTLGACSILLGTFLWFGFSGAGVKSLLCIFFILLTAPVAAHAISRGSHRAGVRLWQGSLKDQYQEAAQGPVPDGSAPVDPGTIGLSAGSLAQAEERIKARP